MYNFETKIDFIGEERSCLIGWDWSEDQVWVQRVEIALVVEHNWTPQGRLKRWREQLLVDVTAILSDPQISRLARQIKADAVKRIAEDYDDGRMLDWEEHYGYRRVA